MTIIAKWPILFNGTLHEVGSVVDGLPEEEEQRLVTNGAAEYPIVTGGTVQTENVPPVESIQMKALRAVLEDSKKSQLLEYAGKVNVQGLTEKQTIAVIVDTIMKAVGGGIDLEAFTDDQLVRFAEQLGVEIDPEHLDPENLNVDAIMDAIEAHLGA